MNYLSIALIVLLVINQSVFLSNISSINYARSENEANVIKQIGYDTQKLDCANNIVFVGKYTIPNSIIRDIKMKDWQIEFNNRLRSKANAKLNKELIVDTNVRSVINWAIIAFGSDGKSVEKLFDYYGYKITAETDKNVINEAKEFANQNNIPCYPEKGYIVHNGDYVIVRLS